ncbi:MAG: hypothetical protein Sapg2KO_02260 [Saprospiraceae bacterium]
MKTYTLLIFYLCLFSQLVAQTKNQIIIPDSATINQWLTDTNVPAIAIGTIQNGQVNSMLVYGNTQTGSPADANTIFDVASLTKSITSLLTLELVLQASWNLDEPLFHYWIDPDLKNDPRHQKLTTRHVLSHRTGFKNWRWMNEDKKLAFDFEPGSKFHYSGEGFEYLRKAMEGKFQIPFEKMADSLIFQPNGMTNSHLTWNEKIKDYQFAGTHDGSGKPYEYEKSTQANAADNLLTTLKDFSQLSANIINKQMLDQDLYQEMIRPQSTVREGISFGLGWIVFNNLANGEYALFNAGSDTGVNALVVLLPKSKRGLIVMTNGDNGRALAMKAIAETLGTVGKEILSRF